MSNDYFSWLHLTDFHFGLKGQDCLWPSLRQPFLDDLAALHERCGPWHAVLFTGDLVQSGESAQFESMQAEVLEPLWQRLEELGSGQAALLAVPGNHDLFRPDPDDDPAALWLLEEGGFERIEAKFWDRPAGPYRRPITNAFAAYSQWWQNAPHRPASVTDGALPGDFSVTLEVGGRRIGIVGLNTTFLQLAGGDYRQRLVWHARQLHSVCCQGQGQAPAGVDLWSRQHDVCLLLSHQGPDWLTPEARKHGETEIAPAGRFAAHLFGHQHEADITYLRRGGSRQAVLRCQGCSVFGMLGEPPETRRTHGYMAGRIAYGEKQAYLRLWPRLATDKTGGWRFIPDREHAELGHDQGTAPEPVAARPRSIGVSTRASTPAAAPSSPSGGVLPATVAAPHSTLPARRPFFGRVDDLASVARFLLPEHRGWGMGVEGPGGIGKTALALEAAYRAPAEHFPLKLWITAKNSELHPEGVQPRNDHRVDDFYALLNELGRALGRDDVPRAVPEERPALVRHALAGHRALLVLDNLETFKLTERRRVFELLDSLPGPCRAIVTSRRRAGSFAAHTLRLDRLEREAASELLAELGRRWPPVARLTAGERDRLYGETGGNPLLLTWTAGQLGRDTGRCRTVAEAIERLQEAHRRDQPEVKNDPLSFVFGDLVETFTADEVAVVAALAHFTQPAPVEWLLPLTELSPTATETALDGLRDRALLVEDDQAGTWLLPPLAARFLRRCRLKEVTAGGERLADLAYALAVKEGHQMHDRYPVLEGAWPRLAAALPVLIAGDNHRLQEVCAALKYFLDFSGRWDDRLSLSTAAEARAERAKDFANAGWRAHDAGWCYYLRGQAPEVLACAERAAGHWQAADAGARERATAIRLRATAIRLRGLGHKLAEDYPAAIIAFREALALWRGLSLESRDVANSLNSLGGVLRESGQLDEAETSYRKALVIAKALPDPEGVANCTGNLAELALDRGEWPRAEDTARSALKLAEGVGRKQLIASDCLRLAKALAHQGRGAEGRCHAERAVAIFDELHSPYLAVAKATLDECLATGE